MSDHLSPEIEALVVDALAGDIDETGRARLDEAMAADPTLAAMLEEQQSVVEQFGAPATPLSELEAARLRLHVLDEVAPVAPATPSSQPKASPWVRWAFSAAAVLVLVVGAVGFLNSRDDTFSPIGADLADSATQSGAAEESSEIERLEAPTSGADTDDADDFAAYDSAESDAGADGGLDETAAGGPACEGEKVRWITDIVYPDIETAVNRLVAEQPAGLEVEGRPVVEELTDLVVLTWFGDEGPETRLELEPADGGWQVVNETSCTP